MTWWSLLLAWLAIACIVAPLVGWFMYCGGRSGR